MKMNFDSAAAGTVKQGQNHALFGIVNCAKAPLLRDFSNGGPACDPLISVRRVISARFCPPAFVIRDLPNPWNVMRLDSYNGGIETASPIQQKSASVEPSDAVFSLSSLAEQAHAPQRSGTQSLERAVDLLKALALRNRAGWRLGDLAARCGIDKGSAHRLLASLIRQRLVEQRPDDRHYLLGPLVWELGLSVPGHPESYGSCHQRLELLARRFGGLAFLMVRSGTEYVCAVRAGDVDLRAVSVNVGTRRPLITSAGGVAILLSLSELETAQVRANNIQQEMARCGDVRLKALEKMYRRSETFGYGVNLGDVVPGIHAVGAPVFSQARKPIASLCLMTWPDNLPELKVGEAYNALLSEAPLAAAACAGTIPM